MKVTSSDCKAYIVESVYPDTKAADWKRQSKKKSGDGVIRVFQNDVTGDAVGVVEKDGQIVGSQEEQSGEVDVLYHITDSEDEPGMHEVSFGTVEDWEKRGCQTDTAIEEVCDVMSKLGLYEDMENFYLVEESQLELIKDMLADDCRFGMRDDFSEFMEECGGE